MVNCINQYKLTKKYGAVGEGLKDDTSTERGNRSRGQETETLWHSGNRREWGHRLVVSYFGRRAYQQKAQHKARCQLQSLKSFPLSIVPFSPQNLSFFHQKCTMKKKFQLCLYTGLVFSGLKGHSFVQSLVCWNLFQWWNSNKKVQILNNGKGREQEGTKSNSVIK